jgi:hypothetical protein
MNLMPPLPANKTNTTASFSYEQVTADYLDHIDKSLSSIKNYLEFIIIVLAVSLGIGLIAVLFNLLRL